MLQPTLKERSVGQEGGFWRQKPSNLGSGAPTPLVSRSQTVEPLYWSEGHPAIRRYAARTPWVESRLPAHWNYAGHYIADAEPVDAAYVRSARTESQVAYGPGSVYNPDSTGGRHWLMYQIGPQMSLLGPQWPASVSTMPWTQASMAARMLPSIGVYVTPEGVSSSAWPGLPPSAATWLPSSTICPTVPHPAYWPVAPVSVTAQQATMDAQSSAESHRFNETPKTTARSVTEETETPAAETMQDTRKKNGRMTYIRFTEDEERLLLEGVALYGIGNWKTILSRMHGFHPKRTPMNLKDKFRNMLRARMRQSAGGRMRPNIAPLLIASTCGVDIVAAAQKRRKPSIRKMTLQDDIERIEDSVRDGGCSVHAELARWIAQHQENSASTGTPQSETVLPPRPVPEQVQRIIHVSKQTPSLS